MKAVLLLCFILFIAVEALFAKMNPLQQAEIEHARKKAERQVKELISNDFSRATGIEHFILNVKVGVNQTEIDRALNLTNKDWQKIKSVPQLPGLALGPEQRVSAVKIVKLTPEDVVPYIRTLSLNLALRDQKYNNDLRRILREIVTKNFSSVKSNGLKISFNKLQALPDIKGKFEAELKDAEIKAKIEQDQKDQKLAEEEKALLLQKEKEEKIYKGATLAVLGALGLIILAGLVILARSIKKGVSGVTSAIHNKSFDSEIKVTHDTTGKDSKTGHENSLFNQDVAKLQLQDQYDEIIQRLKQRMKESPQNFSEMIQLYLDMREFADLAISLDVLSPDKRENLLQKLNKYKVAEYKTYLLENVDSVTPQSPNTIARALRLEDILRKCSVSGQSFHQFYLKSFLSSVKAETLIPLKRNLDDFYWSLMVNYMEPSELSFLAYELEKDLSSVKMEMSDDELKISGIQFLELLKKQDFEKSKVITDAREKVMSYAHPQMEESLGMAVEKEGLFSSLDDAHYVLIADYIKALPIDRITSFLGLFDPIKQRLILNGLPELLRERVKSRNCVVSVDSFRLKAEVYKHLSELDLDVVTNKQIENDLEEIERMKNEGVA